MRYAERWTKVDIENLNLEKVLAWCTDNIQGKQFIDNNVIKFSIPEDASLFKLQYKE